MPNYRDLNAPQLVKQYHTIVGANIMLGRDSHFMKELLVKATSVQILLGMYQYENQPHVSIPVFVSQYQEWIMLDDLEAEVELAVCVAKVMPPDYYVWKELREEQNSESFLHAMNARFRLKEWVDRVLA